MQQWLSSQPTQVLTDGMSAKEKAKIRKQVEVKEDLLKAPGERVRGIRYDLVQNDTDDDFDDDGNEDMPSPAAKGGKDFSSSLGHQHDEDCIPALEDQSEGGVVVAQQPMLEHQLQVLSPPSVLAEPRVLNAEQRENEDNDANTTGNDDEQGVGHGTGHRAAADEAKDGAGVTEVVCTCLTVQSIVRRLVSLLTIASERLASHLTTDACWRSCDRVRRQGNLRGGLRSIEMMMMMIRMLITMTRKVMIATKKKPRIVTRKKTRYA